MFFPAGITKPAKIVIGFANVMQFPDDQLDHDDVIEVSDDRHVVWQDIFRIREINERCEQSLSLILW